jgi:hypothetical protein
MRGWGTSRRALYEQLDRRALQPLPAEPYEYAEWKRCRVNLDYHVEIAKHYYSVPHQLIRQRSKRGSPPRPARFSIAASGLPVIDGVPGHIGRRPSPNTCRVRTGAIATGRTSASAARPAQSATTQPSWLM